MMIDFFYEFFVKPIETHAGYNPVNTLVYAVILLAVAFGLIYPFLNRQGLKFDLRFAFSLLPYILLGTSLRIIEDLRLLPRSGNPLEAGYYLVTPGIWILIGLITIACLLLSFFIARKLNQPVLKVFAVLGLLLALPFFLFDLMQFKELIGFGSVLLLTGVIVFLLVKFFAWRKNKLLSPRFNQLVLGGQVLDACATFVSLQFFSCSEQHFVPLALIQLFTPFSFVLVKIALVLLILYFLDKEVEDPNLTGFIKIIILILGFSTGLRDLLTLAVGSCGSLF